MILSTVAFLRKKAPEGRENLAHGASRGAEEHPTPGALEGREKAALLSSFAPPGLRDPCGFRVPGLTPWARVRRPSGAQRNDTGDTGKIVIAAKVYDAAPVSERLTRDLSRRSAAKPMQRAYIERNRTVRVWRRHLAFHAGDALGCRCEVQVGRFRKAQRVLGCGSPLLSLPRGETLAASHFATASRGCLRAGRGAGRDVVRR
jgi:hypothetical protein